MTKMNRTYLFLLTVWFASLRAPVVGQITGQDDANGNFGTIPSRIAYGPATLGGRGGTIIKVTNLNAGGPGSLKDAIRTPGARIVVFEVAGVIDLSRTNINIAEPFLTIAGQTAPSPGITIIKGGINVRTHDVIIQHIRVRPGDAGAPKKSGFEPDGLSSIGPQAYNIIVDHCSFTWSVDEGLSASGSRRGTKSTSHNITFSNNIIAEGLYQASHSKGTHSMGTLVHDFVQDIAIVGNLYSCNNQRNPFFKSFTRGAVANNLIYNPGRRAIHMNWSDDELKALSYAPENGKISVVGNVLYEGVNSASDLTLITGKGDAYLEDNQTFGMRDRKIPLSSGEIVLLDSRPSWPDNFKPLPSGIVPNYVVTHAGARPKDRDRIDQRIIDDFKKRKGHKIDSQDDVGGYPDYAPVYRKLDVPRDGIENWLAQFSAEVN